MVARLISSLRLAAVVVLVGCTFPALPPVDEDAAIDAVAVDAAVDAESCTATSCVGGTLRVCGPSGTVTAVDECRLGCFSNDRCNWLEPSNGLGVHLVTAESREPVSLPAGTTVNTDSGTISSGGQQLIVATDTIAQSGAPAIRVFMARQWVIDDLVIDGSLPVAFVATGDIVIEGLMDISADVAVAGPGGVTCAGTGAGGHQNGGISPGAWQVRQAGHGGTGMYVWSNPGAGGAGFGTAGGVGGDFDSLLGGPAGASNGAPELTPLRGGCKGGGVNSGGFDVGGGGRGGGAIQLVSGAGEITVMGTSPGFGGVHAGGSGGRGCDNNGSATGGPDGCGTGGGGSGGAILLEAPVVRVQDGAVFLAAGGGGGGSGGCGESRHGQDAPPNGATASGGTCPAEAWGSPAPGGAGASLSAAEPGTDTGYHAGGGGGGGLGRIRINTADGTFVGESNALVRGVLTTGMVTPQ